MKSCLIWIVFVLFGAGAGYGLSYFLDINMYLLISLGIIAGSSMGITWNIHRDKEVESVPENPDKESEEDQP